MIHITYHKDLYLKGKLLIHRFLRLAQNDAVNSCLKSNPFLISIAGSSNRSIEMKRKKKSL